MLLLIQHPIFQTNLFNVTLKISVITISFNSGGTIQKTLDSVFNQSYNNIEHIIVDGGSRDNTIAICNIVFAYFKINPF